MDKLSPLGKNKKDFTKHFIKLWDEGCHPEDLAWILTQAAYERGYEQGKHDPDFENEED